MVNIVIKELQMVFLTSTVINSNGNMKELERKIKCEKFFLSLYLFYYMKKKKITNNQKKKIEFEKMHLAKFWKKSQNDRKQQTKARLE